MPKFKNIRNDEFYCENLFFDLEQAIDDAKSIEDVLFSYGVLPSMAEQALNDEFRYRRQRILQVLDKQWWGAAVDQVLACERVNRVICAIQDLGTDPEIS